jgi:type IV pilus assembly protein PilE
MIGAIAVKRRHQGFTLIELMIVVVIVGILAAIAYPSYSAYVERARRADGKSALLDAAQRLERCHTQTNTYVGCAFPAVSPDGHYAIAATVQDPMEFALTATPQGVQLGSLCGTYVLTSNGARTVDPDPSLAERCW